MSDDKKIEEEKVEPTPLQKSEAGCAEYKARWQRSVADYQNLKKETESRRAEWAQMSAQQILEEFIPVYEHLKLALGGTSSKDPGKSDPWIEGVKYVLKQFADILKSHGVEEMKTVGEQFDPMYHESAGSADAPASAEAMADKGGQKSGTIIREVGGGYKMGGRVIKPARVIISR